MKKEYVNPTNTVYNIRLISSLLTASQENPDLEEGGYDSGSGEADSREFDTNDNNRGSVWDNAW